MAEKTKVYRIDIYRANDLFECRASTPEGTRLDDKISAPTLAALASEASKRWMIDEGEVEYGTISGPKFNPQNNVSRDSITGKEMKEFHHWYMKQIELQK